ncbi:MAG: DUF2849 domain-containing protein [Alphaproteobacteria bacterium]
MAPRKHPQVITANRLDDGEVVYFTPMRRWSLNLTEAQVLGLEDDLDTWLAAARADIERRMVVDVYPFDVVPGDDGLVAALSAREKIRALGPTVRLDLGKQAED